jgi:hypothetical protein
MESATIECPEGLGEGIFLVGGRPAGHTRSKEATTGGEVGAHLTAQKKGSMSTSFRQTMWEHFTEAQTDKYGTTLSESDTEREQETTAGKRQTASGRSY